MVLKLFTIIQVVALTASVLECRADGCAYYRNFLERHDGILNSLDYLYYKSSQTGNVWRCPYGKNEKLGAKAPLCCEQKWNSAPKTLKDAVQAYNKNSLPESWEPVEARVWLLAKTECFRRVDLLQLKSAAGVPELSFEKVGGMQSKQKHQLRCKPLVLDGCPLRCERTDKFGEGTAQRYYTVEHLRNNWCPTEALTHINLDKLNPEPRWTYKKKKSWFSVTHISYYSNSNEKEPKHFCYRKRKDTQLEQNGMWDSRSLQNEIEGFFDVTEKEGRQARGER